MFYLKAKYQWTENSEICYVIDNPAMAFEYTFVLNRIDMKLNRVTTRNLHQFKETTHRHIRNA